MTDKKVEIVIAKDKGGFADGSGKYTSVCMWAGTYGSRFLCRTE